MTASHRIIVTGHSGVRTTQAVERLSAYMFRQDAEWKRLEEANFVDQRKQRERQLVVFEEAEADLKAATDIFRGGFLYTSDTKVRFDRWTQSLDAAIKKLKKSPGETQVLILNASFYSLSEFFVPLFWSIQSKKDPWKLLKNFSPTHFINLYDNIYFARQKIKEEYKFSPAELLHWRNIELVVTDFLASRLILKPNRTRGRENHPSLDGHYPFERSTYFATGHPAATLHRLLFDDHCLRVYLSFPISEPKRQFKDNMARGLELMSQIDEFRTEMGKHFIAFDPLTIDELPLKGALDDATPEQKIIKLDTKADSRQFWPNPYDDPLCGARSEGEIEFRRHELESIARDPVVEGAGATGIRFGSEIENQVRSRDLRLIDQADGLIVYRPGLMKDFWDLGGTRAELQHAGNPLRKKPVIVIHDLADGDLNKPPLIIDVDPNNVILSKSPHDYDKLELRQAAMLQARDVLTQRLRQLPWLK